MVDYEFEPDYVRSCRRLLEKALQCLDHAGLHQAAAHVDMALHLFEMQKAQSTAGWTGRELSHEQLEDLLEEQGQITPVMAIAIEDIEILYRDVIGGNYTDEESVLRKAHVIATYHRREMPAHAAQTGNPDLFHRFLTAGAYNSAALSLLEPGLSYMVSRGPTKGSLASVVMPGMDHDVSAEGPSFAIALVAAYLAALIATCRQHQS